MGKGKMSSKIFGLALCLLFILPNIPVTVATDQNPSVRYTDCYIVSSGLIYNRLAIGLFKIRNIAFIIYLNIGYTQDSITSIYDDENGNLLWQEQGTHNVILLIFRGNYSYVKNQNGSTFLGLEGYSIVAKI